MTDRLIWNSVIEALESASDTVLSNPRIACDVDSLEGIRFLTRVIATGALYKLEAHDSAYPQFSRMVTVWRQWGLPCPDYVYLHAPLHGDFTYRIFGNRGTARMLAFQTVKGNLTDVSTISPVDDLTHVIDGSGDLQIGADGEFEITVSRQRREGNWIEVPEGEGFVAVRNIFYDWETEDPAVLYIEREGATYPVPAYDERELTQQIGRFVEFLRSFPKWQMRAVDAAHHANPSIIPFPPFTVGTDRAVGFHNQYYGQNNYACEQDEAIIMSVTPPRAAYWGFHLASNNWEGFDWDLRQSSINGYQAQVDPDGVFRAVIAHKDPGVVNWLDASNHTRGLVTGRYNRTDAVPIPQLTVVPFSKVRDHLHRDTGTVSPEERSVSVRRRMMAVRRFQNF